jgi:hypothetical protein
MDLPLNLLSPLKLRVFENRVLRRIFGPTWEKWWEAREDYIMRSFITCALHQILQ